MACAILRPPSLEGSTRCTFIEQTEWLWWLVLLLLWWCVRDESGNDMYTDCGRGRGHGHGRGRRVCVCVCVCVYVCVCVRARVRVCVRVMRVY
jgi:hypothetical protein